MPRSRWRTAVAPREENHPTTSPVEAPSSNSVAPSISAPTISDELRVLAALHKVGADLGDPVEVARGAGEIVVSGVGIAPERQQEIQQVLSSMPNVVVRFSESAPTDASPQQPAPENSSRERCPATASAHRRSGGRPRAFRATGGASPGYERAVNVQGLCFAAPRGAVSGYGGGAARRSGSRNAPASAARAYRGASATGGPNWIRS